MFDFAFSELMVICVVALVILGPTRLPGVVRKVGRWIGKARAMARDFRQQLENEVTLDELNRMTERQSRSASAGPAAPEAPPEAAGAQAADTAPGTPAGSSTADAAGATAGPSGTAGDVAGTDPATDPMAATGYPYGMPTDTSGMSSSSARAADPSTVPDPSDDTFSHAHAPGESPAAWRAGDDAVRTEPEAATSSGSEDAPGDTRRA